MRRYTESAELWSGHESHGMMAAKTVSRPESLAPAAIVFPRPVVRARGLPVREFHSTSPLERDSSGPLRRFDLARVGQRTSVRRRRVGH